MNAWSYLALGIFLEVIGTTCLKLSDGFTNAIPSTACAFCFLAALYCLSFSVKSLEIGVVYAIWSGVGVALITLIGAVYFHEALSYMKILFIGVIVIGVVGLQLVSDDKNSNAAPSSKVSGH
jgi:small multidrug resistance pump